MKKNNFMKKIKLNVLLALITVVFMGSCSTRLVDFTVISSKNHSLQIDKSIGIPVKGTSLGFLRIGVSIKDAMDNALQKAGPEYDLLIDGVVRFEDYFLLGGYSGRRYGCQFSETQKANGRERFQRVD